MFYIHCIVPLSKIIQVKESITDFLKISEFRDNIIKLIEAKFELTKLGFQEKIEGIAVKAIYMLLTFILCITVLIFLSILLAIGLNIWMNSAWLGFLIIFILYTILLGVFIGAKDKIQVTLKQQIQEIVDEHINNEAKI